MLSILSVCSLHSPIRILIIALMLLGFNFFEFLGFLSFLDNRAGAPVLLPSLKASSTLGEDSSSRGRRNVTKLPKLLPVNLPRRLAMSSNIAEINKHTLPLTLGFSMHRYPIRRCSVWLGVSPTDFAGSEVFSCFCK
jgi:hypothetical protein